MNEEYHVAYYDNEDRQPRCKDCRIPLTPEDIEKYGSQCEPDYNANPS